MAKDYSELIARLREGEPCWLCSTGDEDLRCKKGARLGCTCENAADAIADLVAENERLVSHLKAAAAREEGYVAKLAEARAALKQD